MFIPPNNNTGHRDSDTIKCVATPVSNVSAGRSSKKNSNLPDEFITLLHCGINKFKIVKYVYVLAEDDYTIATYLWNDGGEICTTKEDARQYALSYAIKNKLKLHPKFFIYFYP